MCPLHFESVVFFGGEFGVSASCLRYAILWVCPGGDPLGLVHAVMYFLVAGGICSQSCLRHCLVFSYICFYLLFASGGLGSVLIWLLVHLCRLLF